jgi:hypothetical protein
VPLLRHGRHTHSVATPVAQARGTPLPWFEVITPLRQRPGFPGARLYLKERAQVGDTPCVHTRLTSSRYTFHACNPWHIRHCCGKRSPTSRSQHHCCGAARVASLGVAKSFRNVLSLPPNGPAWRGGSVCHCCGARASNAWREGSHGVHRYSSLAALLGAGRCRSHYCGKDPSEPLLWFGPVG